jgi:Rod binding domain-containing protein
MNSVSSVQLSSSTVNVLGQNNIRRPTDEQLLLKEKFQDFVAGTFYTQMLKALHSTHGKAAYFHGGQAEEIFQSQMDQQVAENLARNHGEAFADQLFTVFKNKLEYKNQLQARPTDQTPTQTQTKPEPTTPSAQAADRRN